MDPMIIAAAIVLVIGAITTGAVAIIGAFGKMRKDILAEVASVNAKATEIQTLVNGKPNLAVDKCTALETTNAALHAQVSALQERLIADAQRSKGVNES